MSFKKKVAVVVRERQEEGLRMAIGITLLDDQIDVYLLDRKVEQTKQNILNLNTMKEMDMKVFTNCKDNTDIPYLSTEEIAQKLLNYDHIIVY